MVDRFAVIKDGKVANIIQAGSLYAERIGAKYIKDLPVDIGDAFDEEANQFICGEERYDVPPALDKTPAEMRELAYRTFTSKPGKCEALIFWEEKPLTVDAANALWLKYAAEGHEKAAQLTTLISEAKAYIRELYPDEEV